MNKIDILLEELGKIKEDLPNRLEDGDSIIRPTINDFEIIVFRQMWPSTALGLDKTGLDQMTEANTCVLLPTIDGQKAHVYFGGEYAYSAPCGLSFMKNVADRNMLPVAYTYMYNT